MKTPRISVRLFKTLGLLVLIIIVLHAILYQITTYHNTARQIYLLGDTLAQPLSQEINRISAMGGSMDSLFGLSFSCKKIKESNPDLLEVAIINHNGKVLAHNDAGKLNQIFTGNYSFSTLQHIETLNSLDVLYPVSYQNHQPILIKISFTKRLLILQTWQSLLISLLFAAIVIPLLLLTIYLLTNSLFGVRMDRLLDGFEKFAQGKLHVRLKAHAHKVLVKRKPSEDELDIILKSFDQMADKLEHSYNKQKTQEEKLSYLATHDQLTGLPNRRVLEYALKRSGARAKRGHAAAFLLMDIDNFKLVNDTLGHAIGDRVIVIVAELLQKTLRESDLLSRLGGDEFALLLEDLSDIDEAKIAAERLRRTIDEFRFTFDSYSFHLGLSIGIVMIDGHHDPGTLLSQADTAMYNAKRLGRNRISIYRPSDGEMDRLSEASRWITRITDAINEDLFTLHFQPVVRLDTNHIEHFEALLRLKNVKEEKLIMPGEFIPIAEQFGLMPQLDRWVVKNVIRFLEKEPGVHLFMNLSSYSLADESMISFIEERLRRSRVNPQRLGFEITETTMVQDLNLAERWIRHLKLIGCRFALDDFGSGFNSFLYLRNLPLDQLKIDGYFIRTLANDSAQRNMVQAMQEMANALQIETVAEYVEDETTVSILKNIGVTYGQGYFLGKPQPGLVKDSLRQERMVINEG